MTSGMLSMFLTTTFLMIVVLILRHPTRRVFGARIAYLLWIIPPLELVVRWVPLPLESPGAAAMAGNLAVVDFSRTVPSGDAPGWLGTSLLVLWIGGALTVLAINVVRHARLHATILGSLKNRPFRARAVEVTRSASAPGPMAYGLLIRRVILPSDFSCRYTSEERRMIIAHELAHHRRGDIAANWIALLVFALHWFNPVAWIARRAFQTDQEMACDETVLLAFPGQERTYGSAIVKTLSHSAAPTTCSFGTLGQLKRRLLMLSRSHADNRGRQLTGKASVGALIIACLLATSANGQTAREVSVDPPRAPSQIRATDCGLNAADPIIVSTGPSGQIVTICRDRIAHRQRGSRADAGVLGELAGAKWLAHGGTGLSPAQRQALASALGNATTK